MTRVVLIGSRGFVGSAVARHIGSERLVALTRAEADLENPETLRAALSPGDVVINAAGYADVTDRSRPGIKRFRSLNVEGVRLLAQAAIDRRAAQLIHLSSVAAMGRLSGNAIREDDEGPVTTPYAASKREGEEVLTSIGRDIAVTILRPTSVFGEGRGLTRTLCRAATLPVVPLPNGGAARIPLTYVGNVAHAVRLAIANERCYGRTFIVGDTASHSLRTVVLTLADFLGRGARVVPIPTGVFRAAVSALGALRIVGVKPPLDSFRLATLTTSVDYSIRAFQEATGYEPPYDLTSSLREVARWYRHHDSPA